MHMKKKILLISGVLFTLFIVVISVFINNKNNTNNLVLENKEEIKEQISGFNGIAMMYETGPGTGEYSESKSSLWPESGYIFNDTLSGCENGGELSWNDETKAVTLHSNKSDKCYVYFDAYIIPVINSVTTSNIETDSITLTVNVTNGNNPVTTYYYSNNNGNSYETSNSNTYTFSGLDMGTVYNFSVYAEDSAGYKSEVYSLSETTDNAIYICDNGTNLASCIIIQYNGIQGNNGIYYHTSSLTNSAEDNSYRYSGANPNNYVCFGSNEATCPDENLYRIIGVFGNQIKLIKADYTKGSQTGTGGAYYEAYSSSTSNYKGSMITSDIAGYYWSTNSNNIWSNSLLYSTNLNNIYLNNFSSTWRNKIANVTWYVNGYSANSATPATFQDAESTGTSVTAKIGLMYVSDYGFAASPSYWTINMSSYREARSSNWMYMGLSEWTISRETDDTNVVYDIGYTGYAGYTYAYSNNRAIRPCFYLNSNVAYSSGSGTSSDPIRIVV